MSKIVWMDLEMTGLDVNRETIMEIVCVITNNDLDVIATGPELVIRHDQAALDAMDEWCRTTHAKVGTSLGTLFFCLSTKLIRFSSSSPQTGLSAACLRSTTTVDQAQTQLLGFLQEHVKPKESPLAGNTIYMDRRFIEKYMPLVDQHLHYRLIDVSSCKELCKRWSPAVFAKAPKKRLIHRGLDDIMDSIEELRYYRQFMFNDQK